MDSKFRLSPEAEEARYATHNNTPLDGRYVTYLDSFLRAAVLPYADPRQAVLDFGSGPQPVLQGFLYQYGYRAFGYDKFYAPDRSPLHPPYGSIVAIEVLEHLWDPAGVFSLFAELLRPGGILAARTMLLPVEVVAAFDSLDLEEKCCKVDKSEVDTITTSIAGSDLPAFWRWWYRHDGTHVTFYSERSLTYIQERWPLELIREEGRKEVTFRRR